MKIIDAATLSPVNPVIATHAHADVSDRYAFISTEAIMAAFATAGWQPVSMNAVNVRKAGKAGFQKHMVRLEHPDFQFVPGLAAVNDTRPQLMLINSHDRGSSLKIMWGMMRLVCLNGMVATQNVGESRLSHSARTIERLPGAIQATMAALPTMIEQTQALSRATLSAAAVQQLIKTVYDARLEGVERIEQVDYRLPSLRRAGDMGGDAYTIFNRIQEAAIRGGINYTYTRQVKDQYGVVQSIHTAHSRTRAITAIDANVKMNQLAFAAALELVG